MAIAKNEAHQTAAKPFVSAKRGTVCGDIIEQIKILVRNDHFKAGSRLPSERELAEQLGVSRPSVREALRTLASIGVVETRHGSGTQVANSSTNVLKTSFEFLMLLDEPDVFALYEARELVEVYLAGRAAECRTPDDLAAIESALRDMQATIGDPEQMTEPNVRFHEAVAAAAHNPVLERFINCLHEGIERCIETTRPGVSDFQALYQVHEDIYEGIRRQNPGDARRFMTVHMAMAISELRRLNIPVKTS